MDQEIYYLAQLKVDASQNILFIEEKFKRNFTKAKIISVKGNFITVEITTSYNIKFSLEDIESFIYVKLIRILRFYELNVLSLKEEQEIYKP